MILLEGLEEEKERKKKNQKTLGQTMRQSTVDLLKNKETFCMVKKKKSETAGGSSVIKVSLGAYCGFSE